MPIPVILAAAAAVLAKAIAVDHFFNDGRIAEYVGETVGKKAAQAVLDARGIPLDLNGEVNEETISLAISKAVMPEGMVLQNIFDKHAIRRDVEQIAMDYAAKTFGFSGGLSVLTLKSQIVAKVTEDVRSQLESGGTDYVKHAKGLAKIDVIAANVPERNWQAPRVFTVKAARNRMHQHTYRQVHSRIWSSVQDKIDAERAAKGVKKK